MTTQEAINEAIARGHDAMERQKPTLLDRLRETGCNRQPFTPDHAQCVCRLANEAADQIEILEAKLRWLQVISGTLAVHVRGHFAMATATSPTICQEWADKVQDTIAVQETK